MRMRILGHFALLALLVAALPSAAFPQASSKAPGYATIGRETATALSQSQWARVEARFDQRMKEGLPAPKLETAWQQITAQNGAFQHIVGVKVEKKGKYHVALVTCAFEKGNVDVKVSVDGAGRIAGLYFAPAAPPASHSGPPPDYASIGRETVSAIANGNFASVEARFDKRMKAALPESKLSATWNRITSQAGDLEQITGVHLTQQDGYHVAMVACAFAHTNLNAKVVVDPNGKIAGLFFLPAS